MPCTSSAAPSSSGASGSWAVACGRPTPSVSPIASKSPASSGLSSISSGSSSSRSFIFCKLMSDANHPEHFSHHVRRYLFVFYALLFGTLITVGASYIPFGHRAINIGVALFIATGKAFLVAGYFMHLISEKKMIYGIMAFTAFFFTGLMVLVLFSWGNLPRFTVTH